MKMLKRSVLAVLPLVVTSCSSEFGSSTPVESGPKIVGGELGSSISTPTHVTNSTVGISAMNLAREGKTFCSGTLIGEKVVLTAAHCFTENSGSQSVNSPENRFVVVPGLFATTQGNIEIEKIIRHEGYNHEETVSQTRYRIPTHDIALVILKERVSRDKKPSSVPSAQEELPKDVFLAGYGTTGKLQSNSSRTESDTGSLRFVRSAISEVFESGAVVKTGKLVATPKGACPGDSGGPIYSTNESSNFVFGVLSTGLVGSFDADGDGQPDLGCVGENTYTDVRAYKTWIESKL
jgi:secreted trypsin-like serine protease